jgi:hypothetical protein
MAATRKRKACIIPASTNKKAIGFVPVSCFPFPNSKIKENSRIALSSSISNSNRHRIDTEPPPPKKKRKKRTNTWPRNVLSENSHPESNISGPSEVPISPRAHARTHQAESRSNKKAIICNRTQTSIDLLGDAQHHATPSREATEKGEEGRGRTEEGAAGCGREHEIPYAAQAGPPPKFEPAGGYLPEVGSGEVATAQGFPKLFRDGGVLCRRAP